MKKHVFDEIDVLLCNLRGFDVVQRNNGRISIEPPPIAMGSVNITDFLIEKARTYNGPERIHL